MAGTVRSRTCNLRGGVTYPYGGLLGEVGLGGNKGGMRQMRQWMGVYIENTFNAVAHQGGAFIISYGYTEIVLFVLPSHKLLEALLELSPRVFGCLHFLI